MIGPDLAKKSSEGICGKCKAVFLFRESYGGIVARLESTVADRIFRPNLCAA